ncbi:hypothetical protein SAMD00019534_045440 [Acytostelium subglobosum LB1]|uniref:hypothetical protein n=1 Tax=Acytostelium subglobosum LB1 TaxID=1410327 RepID=UPI00064491E9|nr:hypothetical protein SAMD00019534_045440 [Acytostelium subglobosum LB1]GAM21369.1 hypothetical protein SAMD00019534_045440 [Acytostelium subglobosum LB1]|eukprot:XP_012755488.1 hypothetical protein SAMD00019534_045440 [Acytostelium subglobosum LB1]
MPTQPPQPNTLQWNSTISSGPAVRSSTTTTTPTAVDPSSHARHLNPKMIEMISGCGAGAMASLVTTPLDVLKTTIQVRSNEHIGVWRTFKDLVGRSSWRALYIGLNPTLVGLIPSWSIYFLSYSFFKTSLAKHTGLDEANSFPLHMMAAMSAGATTSTLTNPIWVIKTRLITQEMSGRQKQYSGIIQCFQSILKQEGVAGLYKGLGPSLLGLIHVGVQLPLYERFKIIIEKRKKTPLTTMDIVIASSTSKMIASIVAYPHEVLRSRLQDSSPNSPHNYKGGLLQNFKQIVQQEGVRGLYKGMGVNLIRVTPACAITFATYEYIKKQLTGSPS